MKAVETLPMFTAEEAVSRFADVLDVALKRPVGISSGDELVAYVVSKQDVEQLFAKIQELEDQVWLKEAELGRQSGFIGHDEVEALVSDVRNPNHDEARDSE